jgi:hypothetical protein
MLRSEAAVGGVIRLSTVTEAHIPWQGGFAETPKHPQVGLPTICQPQFVKFLSHLYDRLTMNPARIVADTLT